MSKLRKEIVLNEKVEDKETIKKTPGCLEIVEVPNAKSFRKLV